MTTAILSQTKCQLGEGPLWHPERGTLFWFDILSHRLFEHDGTAERHWQFDRAVSAAGWVDRDRLLVASERDLFVFDLETGAEEHIVDLEADIPGNRSNDGRADPFGGFWIGTMSYDAAPGAGAIYRYYRGELRRILSDITITNAICFAPDGSTAYFADTVTDEIRKVALDAEGWPSGAPERFVDLTDNGWHPDGAVVDVQGNLWNAQWGHSRVACYASDGTFLRAVPFPATQISCPCFGGPDLGRLFATSAAVGTGAEDPQAGLTFVADLDGLRGQAEHRVIL
ncbi:SMP-30/gluconolactonase/LRE family protein [Pseudoponticoccus marisrubri]|uniref:Gluconolactonase n=1 Tax=Pseudoponticoccus marisrubri TaxID=1685382 RepID=A0A0W7WLD2_9RHOB|nr:SMP-30/gluconolactonase/LRE family protein [Pseudoponticoccus marisrubri]KUF11288.1 gluconolactonase [Pseudoponticoccus marisrubri]